MFRRENPKCFGETGNHFGVNHQARKVSERVRNFLEGARNVLGPSRIFPEGMRTENIKSPPGGQDPPIRGGCFLGHSPFGGQPTNSGKLVAPPPWWGAAPTFDEEMLGGAPLGQL